MTKKKDSKVYQDDVSELEEVQDNIEQPEEKSDLEEEVEPSPEEKCSPGLAAAPSMVGLDGLWYMVNMSLIELEIACL